MVATPSQWQNQRRLKAAEGAEKAHVREAEVESLFNSLAYAHTKRVHKNNRRLQKEIDKMDLKKQNEEDDEDEDLVMEQRYDDAQAGVDLVHQAVAPTSNNSATKELNEDKFRQNFESYKRHDFDTPGKLISDLCRFLRLYRQGKAKKAMQALDYGGMSNVAKPGVFDKLKTYYPRAKPFKRQAGEQSFDYKLKAKTALDVLRSSKPNIGSGVNSLDARQWLWVLNRNKQHDAAHRLNRLAKMFTRQDMHPDVARYLLLQKGFALQKIKPGKRPRPRRSAHCCVQLDDSSN